MSDDNKVILHFRLVNQEEILGQLVDETDYEVHILNPYIVVEGAENIILSKYVPFQEDQTVRISRTHIITMTNLHPEMIRYYENTKIVGKSASETAIKGLAAVNEQMEEYIYKGSLPDEEESEDEVPRSMLLETRITHSSANTVH